MSDVLTTGFLTALLSGAVLATLPLLLAALGESVSEQAGVLNVGLEGMMLAGAYGGFFVAVETGSQGLGLVAGLGAGILVAGAMAFFAVRLGLDQIVVGIALLLIAEGVTSVLQQHQYGTSYPRLEAPATIPIPGLSAIPVVGTSLFDQPLVVYLAGGLVALWWYVRSRTSLGLALRAAGERPAALDAAGVSVTATRALAVLATGAGAGLGGAYLAVVGAGVFVPFMTGGAGFIAIVVAMLARGRAVIVLAGAAVFGTALSAVTALQLVGVAVPQDVINMLPFVAVMIALVVFAGRAYLPAALAVPYRRDAR